LQFRFRPGGARHVARGGPHRAHDRGCDRAGLPALRLLARRGALQVRFRSRTLGGSARDAGATESMTRLAVLSVHTCPLAALGAKETGGMNVYVREVARALGHLGHEIDVFTRSQDPAIQEVVPLGPRARVVHVSAGPARPIARAAVAGHLS